jgi:hypothetical protein
MKQLVLVLMACGAFLSSLAQNDTTSKEKVDTIKVGGIIIIKKPGKNNSEQRINILSRSRTNRNISTNWLIVDLGFANWNDNTNYGSAAAQAFAPGYNKENLDLNNGKSVNVNIWLFMQKINIVKHVVNLKYGLGIELNNYRFDDKRVKIQENPTLFTLNQDWTNLIKNKLAADYVTVPVMLNFDLTPSRRKGFGFSVGASVGYLYSGRQKVKYSNGDKEKFKDDFDLRPFKVSYIGELSLGPVRLYGSYATQSMWEKGFNHRPYNVGIRLSNW